MAMKSMLNGFKLSPQRTKYFELLVSRCKDFHIFGFLKFKYFDKISFVIKIFRAPISTASRIHQFVENFYVYRSTLNKWTVFSLYLGWKSLSTQLLGEKFLFLSNLF